MNSLGQRLRITTWGESHGPTVGVVIDGFPAGFELDMAALQHQMGRRRPGQSRLTTRRDEPDQLEVLSGVFEGKTTGAPLALMVRNADARPADYDHLATAFRPSHADYTYHTKYGHRDHRGGGRSSARETLARVAAGALARQWLAQQGITATAWVSQVGPLVLEPDPGLWTEAQVDAHPVRCPHPALAEQMAALIEQVRKEGDTVGGIITGCLAGVPPGLGEPVFGKLHADLGAAMLGINACKGFEYGSGFRGAAWRGSEHNDLFYQDEGSGRIRTRTNHSGGVQGGISNGEDITFRVAFKPVATLLRPQPSLDASGQEVTLPGKGRHDPCVLPRAVPIVEAMACLVVMDHCLRAGYWQFMGPKKQTGLHTTETAP